MAADAADLDTAIFYLVNLMTAAMTYAVPQIPRP
jgi:hypothetical protein